MAPDAARFCPSCGHALVARHDERRVVSVVFADLVGFTSFSEASDPEQVKALVDECFEALCGDVEAYGGQVDKIVGDAVLALFGAPVAHEDDAERAVRCALRMQRTLTSLRENRDLGVELRVGVNTGEVLVGALRAGGDYTAMGDVVNTAQSAPDRGRAGPGRGRRPDPRRDPARRDLRGARPAGGAGPLRAGRTPGTRSARRLRPGSVAGPGRRSSGATRRSA